MTLATREEVVLDPAGAAFFPSAGALAISDLHLGYEATMRAAGAGVPTLDRAALFDAIDGAIARHRPDVLVVTGDVKHGFSRVTIDEARDVRAAWRRLSARAPRVVLLEGNHDAGLAKMVPDAEIAPWLRLGGWLFAHGHERVPREASALARGLVVGHEHPAVTLADELGVGLRARAFLRHRAPRGRETVVLPALSPWAAGYDVTKRGPFLGPLLARKERDRFRAHVLADGDVLDFGEVGSLRRAMARR